jgi:hypothetical protein
VQPGAQQLSPDTQVVIGVATNAALHVSAVPVIV